MKKLLKLVSITILGSVMALTANGCSSQGELLVATNAEFPPFESMEGVDFVGFDIDLAKEIGVILNKKVKFQNMDFVAVIASVESGSADMALAGLTINDERKQSVDFTNTYFNASQVILVKDSNTEDLSTAEKTLEYLKNKKIGVQAGTTAEYFVKGDADMEFVGISGAECVGYQSGALAVLDLKNSKIDAVMIDEAPARNFAKNTSGIKVISQKLTDEEYAIAVKKGNTAFLDSVNNALKTLKDNGKFDELYAKHFG